MKKNHRFCGGKHMAYLRVSAALAGLLALCGSTVAGEESSESRPHMFEIGEKDFPLDGNPFVLRCGEVHYARIPHESGGIA